MIFSIYERLSRWLSLPDAVQEEQLVRIGCAIHGVKVDARPTVQHLLAQAAGYNRLQLLEVSHGHHVRQVRLFRNGLCKSFAL